MKLFRQTRKHFISIVSVLLVFLVPGGTTGQTEQNETAAGHDTFSRLLGKYVNQTGFVDYKAWHGNDEDCIILQKYINSLGPKSNVTGVSSNGRMALWINAYNAITIKAILDHYPLPETASFFSGPINYMFYPSNSIKQIPGVWDDIKTKVGGRTVSLNDIEHKILRIEFKDPRIHGAINCASRSCPPLWDQAFTGLGLDEQLDARMKAFLNMEGNFSCNATDGLLQLSKIFDWFAADFQKHYERRHGSWAARRIVFSGYLADFAPPEYKTCLSQPNLKVEYYDYDWTLNGR